MATLNPYLTFNGNCKEVMGFYKDCLGGELELMIVGDTPAAEHFSPEMKDNVMHACLSSGEFTLMASDCVGQEFNVGNNVSLSLHCTCEEEINSLFVKLSEGGEVKMPLEPTFWGAIFGHFIDKYGINWLLNYQLPQA